MPTTTATSSSEGLDSPTSITTPAPSPPPTSEKDQSAAFCATIITSASTPESLPKLADSSLPSAKVTSPPSPPGARITSLPERRVRRMCSASRLRPWLSAWPTDTPRRVVSSPNSSLSSAGCRLGSKGSESIDTTPVRSPLTSAASD